MVNDKHLLALSGGLAEVHVLEALENVALVADSEKVSFLIHAVVFSTDPVVLNIEHWTVGQPDFRGGDDVALVVAVLLLKRIGRGRFHVADKFWSWWKVSKNFWNW